VPFTELFRHTTYVRSVNENMAVMRKVYLFNLTAIKRFITVGRLKEFGSKTVHRQICTLNMATMGERLYIGMRNLVVICAIK
jgi:hypothetical protein